MGGAVSVLLVLLVAVPLLAAATVLVLPRRLAAVAALIGMVAASATALVAVALAASRPWRGPAAAVDVDLPWIPALGVRLHLQLDGISTPLVLLTAALGVAVLAAVIRPPSGRRAGEPSSRVLISALLLVEAGALGTFVAADLVVFFIAFELVLVPMWAIVRWWGDPGGRRDAATRFVLYTAFGSVLLLAGILVVAGQAGTTDLSTLTAARGAGIAEPAQLAAAVLLVAGLAVKVPVWPLHTWLPPAHTSAPTVGSVLLAGVLLKMGTYGMVRLVVPVVPDGFDRVAPVLAVLGVVGIGWGGLVCLRETDLKRLVAYSSVAHMGFVVLGIASGTPQGLQGALFANVAHGVVSSLLFVVAGGLKDRAGSGRLDRIGGGLRDGAPRLGALLAVGCVAGLGLPGLIGFWGEVLAAYGAWQGRPGSDVVLWRTLAVFAVAGTALAAAYHLRVLRRCWHGLPQTHRPAEPPGAAVSMVPPGAAALAVTSADATGATARSADARSADATGVELAIGLPLVVVTVVLGLVPWLLLRVTEPGVQALLGLGQGSA
ncbi:MAG: complex I subunit 4 family protein [Angustibacter sp.]